MNIPVDAARQSPIMARRLRALVICTHLRPSRDKRKSRYFMQSIAGLHVASQIDTRVFDVALYHEDWHGPYDTSQSVCHDIVFLSGLQVDFDRMRQLSCHFRRAGAITVAGGSICTSFPEFAAEFFDVVCAGGVDSTAAVIADFVASRLQRIYRSPISRISSYAIDHSILARSGISPSVHLIEASRGCSFKCSFCVIPSEVGGHAAYPIEAVLRNIDDSIAASPRRTFRRRYPLVMFLDNNLSDDRNFLLEIAAAMQRHPKVRGWAALVTQNILHDRPLMALLAASGCVGLFAGIESFDPVLLKRFHKSQNLGKRFNILDDIFYAERLGIAVGYGHLFDPRHQTAADMAQQLLAIAKNPKLPMPVYLSVVAPLAGTKSFWEDLAAGHLAPNLRLRDLDGETLCYRGLADTEAELTGFVERMFRRPWTIVGRYRVIAKTLRRVAHSGTVNPVRWYLIAAANLHCYVWSRSTPSLRRSWLAGSDRLDPQYAEIPAGLSDADRRRYFEPVALTDGEGRPQPWLEPYFQAAIAVRQPYGTVRAERGVVL